MSTDEIQPATLDPAPLSWTAPGTTDTFAIYGLITLFLIIFLIIYLYAVFDRYAERKGEGSPLRTTVPTMLTVGLAYDLLPPLEGVSALLPLSLILAAAARDLVLWLAERGDGAPAPEHLHQSGDGHGRGAGPVARLGRKLADVLGGLRKARPGAGGAGHPRNEDHRSRTEREHIVDGTVQAGEAR